MMIFELYAIGNALVDQEFSVTDEVLSQHGLTKGTMQLSDHEQQAKLLQSLDLSAAHCKQASGGSAANTAYAFAALGGKTFYACRVGDDARGHFYLNDLNQAGVVTSSKSKPLIQLGETTGTCVVMVSPDGERTMQTHLGISSELSNQQIDLDTFKNTKVLYIEGYLATSPSARAAVNELKQSAKAQNTQIALTLSDPAMVQYAREGLDDLLSGGVDIIFCNEDEAKAFTNTTTIADALQTLRLHGKLIIITQSEKGATIGDFRQGETIIQVPAKPVDTLLDTNGAGDSYAGAFLYGLSQNMALDTCGKLAANIAAAVVQQYGARLPQAAYQQLVS